MFGRISKLVAVLVIGSVATVYSPAIQADENVGEKVESKARDAKRDVKYKKKKKSTKNKAKEAGETVGDKAEEVKDKTD